MSDSGLAEVLEDRLSVCDCDRQGAVLEALAEILKAVDAGIRVRCCIACKGCPARIEGRGVLRGCAFVRMIEVLDQLHWTLEGEAE